MLARAQNEARYALGTGGARVVWRDCDKRGICDGPIGWNEFAILLRNRPPSSVSKALRSDALGLALLVPDQTSVYAIVYSDDVQRLASQFTAPVADQLLGYAIAHEIGHLLLGPDHRAGTVMKDRWTVEDVRRISRRELRFDRRERDDIRVALMGTRLAPFEGALKLAASFGFPLSSARR